MILRSRGAKAPLLSVDLMSVSVGLISREGGLLSPCSWTCGCEIYSSGRDKKYGYRNGIQTDLGDIRNDVWLDLVRELIVRSHEEDLFDKLLEWEKEHTYWLKTKAELEHYTLELYAARIFDNPKWVDYEAFAKHYGYQPQSYEG